MAGVSSIITYAYLAFSILKRLGFKATGYIVAFFQSGLRTYLAMLFIVFYSNRDLFLSLDPVKIIIGLGKEVGRADRIIAENLEMIILGVQGLDYIDALLAMVSATFLILWHIRTVSFASKYFGGDNIPPFWRNVIAVGFYLLAVIAAEQRLPISVFEVLWRFPELVEVSRLNPLTSAEALNASTEFVNGSVSGNFSK